MGFLKGLASAILDEVGVFVPEVNELRWNKMVRDYEKEENSYSYSSSSSGTSSKKTSNTSKRGTQKKKVSISSETEEITLEQFLSYVEDVCEGLNNRYPTVFSAKAKLRKNLRIPDDIEIYLQHDESMTQNGGYGFAVTSIGIYSKEMFSEPKFVSYEELAFYKMSHIQYTAYINNKMILDIMPNQSYPERETAKNALVRAYHKIAKEYVKIK